MWTLLSKKILRAEMFYLQKKNLTLYRNENLNKLLLFSFSLLSLSLTREIPDAYPIGGAILKLRRFHLFPRPRT